MRTTVMRLLLAFSLVLASSITAQAAQDVDLRYYYKLAFRPQFTGVVEHVDVYNDGSGNYTLDPFAQSDSPGQYWRLRLQPGGFYKLTTQLLGRAMCLGLDTSDNAYFAPCSASPAQLWKVIKKTSQASDPGPDEFFASLVTQLRGDGMCLNVVGLTPCDQLRDDDLWYFLKTSIETGEGIAQASAGQEDFVNWSIQAAYIGGALLGVPISQDEVEIVRGLVNCGLGKTLQTCAAKEIAKLLPPEAQDFAACVLSSDNVLDCAIADIIVGLPPPMQELARCLITQPDIGQACISFAVTAGERQALSVIDRLKADGRTNLDGEIRYEDTASGRIRNLIAITQGARDDDWIKVSIAGGTVVYQALVKIVLNYFLPFLLPAGPLIDGVIDAIVQRRADELNELVSAIRAKDGGAIAEIVAEVMLFEGVLETCDALKDIEKSLPIDIFDSLCGPTGDVIKAAAGLAADGYHVIEAVMRRFLPRALWPHQRQPQCVEPEDYYTGNFAYCIPRGTSLASRGPYQIQDATYPPFEACVNYYNSCEITNSEDVCNAIDRKFLDQASYIYRTLSHSARAFQKGWIRDERRLNYSCDALTIPYSAYVESFMSKCMGMLARRYPEKDEACFIEPQISSHKLACERVLAEHPLPTLCHYESGGGECTHAEYEAGLCHTHGPGHGCNYLTESWCATNRSCVDWRHGYCPAPPQ